MKAKVVEDADVRFSRSASSSCSRSGPGVPPCCSRARHDGQVLLTKPLINGLLPFAGQAGKSREPVWPASPPRSTTDGCSQQTIGRLLHTGSGSGCAVGGFSVPAEHLFWFRGSCLQAPPSLVAERGNLRISR